MSEFIGQYSLFDFVPDWIDVELLRCVGSFSGSRNRVKEHYIRHGNNGFADVIAKEFGIGGYAGPNRPRVDYNGRGYRAVSADGLLAVTLTWAEVAKRVANLIENGPQEGTT